LDDKVILDIKPNSLPANAFVGIKPITKNKMAEKPDMLAADAEISKERYMILVEGLAYEIVGGKGTLRDDASKTITELSQRGFLNVTYNDTNGDGLVDGLNVKPSMLYLAYLNTNTKKWELIQQEEGVTPSARVTGVLASSHLYKVTFGIMKFGTYRVIAAQEPPEPVVNLINYPNPFVPDKTVAPDSQFPTITGKGTIIYCELQTGVNKVNVAIYTVFGSLVKTWEFQPADIASRKLTGSNGFWFEWDGRNGAGQVVANGAYILKLEAKTDTSRKTLTRKIAVW
jgi:hypothetical protein